MRFFLTLSICFAMMMLRAQEVAGIEYSPTGIFSWSMFKGKINPRHIAEMGKNTGAVTVSSLSYQTLDVTGRSATIKISATFNPYESWTKYPRLDHPEAALNHEKRHFEICEIYARKIRQEVTQAHFNRYNFNRELDSRYRKLVNEYHAEQDRYDLETEHSLNNKQQEKWNTWIDAQLKALNPYSDPVVNVTIH